MSVCKNNAGMSRKSYARMSRLIEACSFLAAAQLIRPALVGQYQIAPHAHQKKLLEPIFS